MLAGKSTIVDFWRESRPFGILVEVTIVYGQKFIFTICATFRNEI
jgi:hypothetical protein